MWSFIIAYILALLLVLSSVNLAVLPNRSLHFAPYTLQY